MIIIVISYCSFISQLVFLSLPGRQPANFYLCSSSPGALNPDDESAKIHWQFVILQLLSIAVHVFINVKIKLYKVKMNKSVGPVTVGTDYGNCCFFAPQVHLGTTGNEMRDFEAL